LSVVPVPSTDYELALVERGVTAIAGVDEAGRGCLAGPVVAGAVVLPTWRLRELGPLANLRDSKMLAPSEREYLYGILCEQALAFSVGQAEADVVDEIGVVPATRRAMLMALQSLPLVVEHALVDYLRLPEFSGDQTAIIHGDALCLSISAASIIAKVTRDRQMVELDRIYPGYGFARHKGYGTADHLLALRAFGLCPLHRRTFGPVRNLELETAMEIGDSVRST
jgi:ribonuclease HII